MTTTPWNRTPEPGQPQARFRVCPPPPAWPAVRPAPLSCPVPFFKRKNPVSFGPGPGGLAACLSGTLQAGRGRAAAAWPPGGLRGHPPDPRSRWPPVLRSVIPQHGRGQGAAAVAPPASGRPCGRPSRPSHWLGASAIYRVDNVLITPWITPLIYHHRTTLSPNFPQSINRYYDVLPPP